MENLIERLEPADHSIAWDGKLTEKVMETEKKEKDEQLTKLISALMQTKAEPGTLGNSLLRILEKNTSHNNTLEIIKYGILTIAIGAVVLLQIKRSYTAEVGTILGIAIGHLFTKKSE